jgi:radical SAM superfamily enzyme YgiQ (UPF0313 family)
MNNILLLEPPSNMQKLQKVRSRKPHFGVPLPFIYIAPYLLKEGFKVDMLDLRISSLSELKHVLQRDKPLIAGISIMPGSALLPAIKLNKLIKRNSQDTMIVWGGSFPSLHYEFCLGIPGVDLVVCGDGEVTLTEVASVRRNGSKAVDLKSVRGIAFKGENGVITTARQEPINLDDNPIGAWQLVDKYIDFYLGPARFIAINTARGCPFKCSFCYNNLLYKSFKRYRFKSIQAVMQEVEYLVERYDLKRIQFLDDDFLGYKKRGMELVSALHGRYPDIKYHIAARVSELLNENTVSYLAETGCYSAFIGAETGTQKQLEDIQKGCSTNDTLEAGKLCAKHGIKTVYSFTCGYPGESVKDLYATATMAGLLREIDSTCRSYIEIISPISGTPLFAELRENNLLPENKLSKWCYMTDWKSAKHKLWIRNPGFYEAFQLMFFLAYSSSDTHQTDVRLLTQILSRWSRFRISKKPNLVPEFRLANFILKKALWNEWWG